MTILINPRDGNQIEFVLRRLREDEAVALPTETVYGLAARALSTRALARVFELKARPTFDPLIVHVLDWEQLESLQLVEGYTPVHQKLTRAFWPGPLTLLFQKSQRVPDLCTASTPYVALRAPSHPVFRKILENLKEPLAAPSANRFKSISPTCAQDVVDELGPFGLVAVVDGGVSSKGIESTVVKVLSNDQIEIVRQGAISQEDLISCLGASTRVLVRKSGSGAVLPKEHEAPGQSAIHYAPKKPLYLLNEDEVVAFLNNSSWTQVALLEIFPSHIQHPAIRRRECLSPSRFWSEAAARLFATMRLLDRDPRIDVLLAVRCSSEQLGAAILDRLERAAQKH